MNERIITYIIHNQRIESRGESALHPVAFSSATCTNGVTTAPLKVLRD